MATLEFEKRMERRRRQRWWEELNRQPEVMVLRREIARRARYQRRHPFSGQSASIRGLLYMHCVYMGIRFGGRARKAGVATVLELAGIGDRSVLPAWSAVTCR
jgi:hypothetical protein